jgi:hypothetical protein
MTQPIERAIELLENLSVTQFKKVLLIYQVPKSDIPPAGTQGEQAIAVVEYTIQKEGEQLTGLFEVINKVAPQKKDQIHADPLKINIDPLIFHLANRAKQEDRLSTAIYHHNQKQHPFICLIHGDQDQCSDKFVDRLVQHYLPSVIKENNIELINLYNLYYQDVNLHKRLSKLLAENLGINSHSTLSEIGNAIVRKQSAIIFCADMCTTNWLEYGKIKLLNDFIEYWTKLELPARHNHLLLVFLFFNYTDTISTNLWFINWFKKPFINKIINKKIRKEFIQLEKENFLKKFGINGLVLPELINITRQEVLGWARKHLDDNVFHIVRPKIENLCSDYETIPMCKLATELYNILKPFLPNAFKD